MNEVNKIQLCKLTAPTILNVDFETHHVKISNTTNTTETSDMKQ